MTKENRQNTMKKIISLSKQAHKLNKEGRYKTAEEIFKRPLIWMIVMFISWWVWEISIEK